MDADTRRQRITDRLREGPATPSELAAEERTTPATIVEHVRHVARSLEHDEESLLVSPPACRDCEFDRFDDPANLPSRCPECRSESIDEPTFVIR